MTHAGNNDSKTGQAPIGVVLSDWLADARTAIETSKRFMEQDEIHLGWFILRDLEVTKRADLSDLAWSGHREGVTKGELKWFIEQLERYLSSANNAIVPPATNEHS